MWTMLTDSVPRTLPQIDVLIPSERWRCMKNEGIVEAGLDENPKGFTQEHVLHGLTTTRSVVLTIPVVRPDSN